jgi:hypothetical protein
MSEQTFNSPPPIPSSDEPPELNVKPNEWHYVANGVKNGPVSATTIRDLLNKNEIEADTQVWRKGMTDWKDIRESDLAELVATEPPAISPPHIGNGYVWILAFLPLIWGVIDASIDASNQQAAARTMVLGFPYHPIKGLPVQIPFVANALFGWLDELRLRKAGYGSKWMRAAAVLLTPVYLFARAKRLKQTPWYAVCWLVSLIAGFLIYASVDG